MRSVAPKAIIVFLLILLLDALTKAYIVQEIPPMHAYSLWYPYGGYGVFQDFFGIEFSIVHLINKGAAWGTLPQYQQELLYLRLFLVIALIVYLFISLKNPAAEVPLAMIIAGATGNIIDTFIYGHVIDMIHFVFWGYEFPAFNVADASICLGVAWLLIASWRIVPAYQAGGKSSKKKT